MTAPTPGTDATPPDPTRPPVGAEPHRVAVTGASWPVDGGILQTGPMAGSHPGSHDWRRP